MEEFTIYYRDLADIMGCNKNTIHTLLCRSDFTKFVYKDFTSKRFYIRVTPAFIGLFNKFLYRKTFKNVRCHKHYDNFVKWVKSEFDIILEPPKLSL